MKVEFRPRLRVNTGAAVRSAVLKGLGIAPLPLVMARESVEQGHLRQVLAPWHPRSVPIYAIYPSKRYLTAKVRAFVELAALAFSKATSR